MRAFNVLVVVLVLACHAGAAEALTEKLQRGLFEEEANHNLDAAIKEYQSVVAQSDEQRKVTATALFRLGECYRKLGKTNEANEFYQRVVRDFSEQEQLVKLSRELLPRSDLAAGRTTTPADPVSVNLLREEIAVAERVVQTAERNRAAGRGTLREVIDAKKEVLRLKRQLPENASPTQQRALLEEQISIVKQLLSEFNKLIEVGRLAPGDQFSVQRELLALQRELALVGDNKPSSEMAGTSMTQAEADAIANAKSLVQNSPDLLNAPAGGAGYTPLQAAVNSGHYQVASFLLANGATANAGFGSPSVVLAATKGNLRLVELLLDKGAEVNGASPEGKTALIAACEQGFKSVADLLVARGADVNRQTHKGETALHYATHRGNSALVELLLEHKARPDVLFNQNPGSYWTPYFNGGAAPLHIAGAFGYATVAQELLKAGAAVDATNFGGLTPLHFAATHGKTNLCDLLLDRGANVNTQSMGGITPLASAVQDGRLDTATLLLRRGANVNLPSRENPQYVFYPLHRAVGARSAPILKALLEAKPDLEVRNGDAFTPLQQAVNANYDDMAALLLEAGTNPNETLLDNTLLHHAVIGARLPLVAGLLKRGANPNVVNRNGETPLSLALGSIRQGSPIPANSSFPGSVRPVRQLQSPTAVGAVNISPTSGKAVYEEIVTLLKQHGADEYLQRRGSIQVAREGDQEVIFQRGTNQANHFSLLELFGAIYETAVNVERRAFPDLVAVTIRRLAGQTETVLRANVDSLLESGDCERDIWLEWGDIVEIPVTDHPLNSQWPGLVGKRYQTLTNCLQRTVKVIAGGTNATVTLRPRLPVGVNIYSAREPTRTLSFRLAWVVQRDNRVSSLLRTSSDLSRVTVTRIDPETKETRKMTFDLNTVWLPGMSSSSYAPPVSWLHDLWLRDGDVIEIPEKQ